MEKKCENCKKYYNCAELVYYNDLTMGFCEDYYMDKEADDTLSDHKIRCQECGQKIDLNIKYE